MRISQDLIWEGRTASAEHGTWRRILSAVVPKKNDLRPVRPLVDTVAKIGVSVNAKLLAGFLVGALLLVGMGALSLVVISRMDQRVQDMTFQQERVDRARQMEYAVTSQMHFRAMTLIALQCQVLLLM